MNERIRLLIEQLGLTQAEFAERVKVQPSTLSNALRGRNEVSNSIIIKIHEAYPEVSINWLMFGEGDLNIDNMVTNPKNQSNEIPFFSDKPSKSLEYSKDFELRKDVLPFNDGPSPIVEKIPKDRKVVKIMIFYSDNTFESFSSDQIK